VLRAERYRNLEEAKRKKAEEEAEKKLKEAAEPIKAWWWMILCFVPALSISSSIYTYKLMLFSNINW